MTQTWYSYVWTTRLDPETFAPLERLKKFEVEPPFKSMDEWLPCLQPPMYVPANNSISVIESVGGLEDPRLLVRTNPESGEPELGMTFFSNPPRDLEAEAAGTAPGPLYGLWYAIVEGEPPYEGLCPSKGRVWLTPMEERSSEDQEARRASGFEREQGHTFTTEKNWMYFESALREKLFVTEIEPHTITVATTTATSTKVRDIADTITARLDATVRDKGVVIHGGANPIFIRENVLLGSFHTILYGKYTSVSGSAGQNTKMKPRLHSLDTYPPSLPPSTITITTPRPSLRFSFSPVPVRVFGATSVQHTSHLEGSASARGACS